MKHIRVVVPATISNLGQLHSCAAIAIELYNTVDVIETEIGLSVLSSSTNSLIKETFNHPVIRGITAVFRTVGISASGLQIHLEQNIPSTAGLHSQTAFLIGGMLAANSLLENPLTRISLMEIARLHGASPACVHAALHGNLAICSEKLNIPLCATVALPSLTIATTTLDQSPSAPHTLSRDTGLGEHLVMVEGLRTGNMDLLKKLTAQLNQADNSGNVKEPFEFFRDNPNYALISPPNSLPLIGISDKTCPLLLDEVQNYFNDAILNSIHIVGIDRYGITISESGDTSHTQIPTPVSQLKVQYEPSSPLITD